MKVFYYRHRVLNINIELINHVDYIMDELKLLFSYSFDMEEENVDNKEHMEIMETDGGYVYIWNKKMYYDIPTKEELFWILNEVLCGEIFTEQKEWLILHSAAIAYKGNILVFVADSKRGKSTFSTALSVHKNCKYITDDLLPIRKSDLLCCDFHKPISIRESSDIYSCSLKNCLSKEIFIKYNGENKKLVFPKNITLYSEPTAIKAFVFLNRDKECISTSVHRLPNQNALSKIIKSFMFSKAEDIPIYAIKLVQNYTFYQLNYSGVENMNIDEFLNEIIC